MERARAHVIEVMRAVRSIRPEQVAAPLRDANPGMLEGFRRLMTLRESDPAALDRLVEIVTIFEPRVQDRLDRVADALPDKRFRSMREVLAKRDYRRVHCAALGGGAAAMWSFGREPEAMWIHGNAAGLLTVLACQGDEDLRDEAFAAGLLHHIGRVALVAAPTDGTDSPPGDPPLSQEPLYAEAVGRAVLAKLQLPGRPVETAVPCGLRPAEPTSLALLANAACYVANRLGFVDEASGPPDPSPDAAALDRVTRALMDAGGPEWISARLGAPLVAAREGVASALQVA